MQPQLKANGGAVRVWQALALTFSASALTLSLCAKPAQSGLQPLPTKAAKTAVPPPAIAEAAALSRVDALRDDGGAAALESLIAIVQQAEPKLSKAALEGIAQIGGDRAREFLVRRFDTAGSAALPALASALATLGDPAGRAVLQSAAQSTRPAARSAAFSALSTLDSADVREFMLRALTFVDPAPAAAYFSDCRARCPRSSAWLGVATRRSGERRATPCWRRARAPSLRCYACSVKTTNYATPCSKASRARGFAKRCAVRASIDYARAR